MKDDLEHIDEYLKGELSADDLRLFDQRVIDDPVFAGDLAFYLSSVNVIKNQVNEEKKQHFREIYEESKSRRQPKMVRTFVPYLAAAAVIGLISIIIFIFYPVSSPSQLADRYINENLTGLGVSMSGTKDSVQTALRYYNEGKLNEALGMFEKLSESHPSDHKVKEYAGIVSLRLADYDKSLKHFRELEALVNLYANPGKFYVALTLMKRSGPGDIVEAKKLLQQVIDQRLEHDADARELLDNL